jgi:hypothetical protein
MREGVVLFFPESYNNFWNGQPIYWLLVLKETTFDVDGGNGLNGVETWFTATPVTKSIGNISDGWVWNGKDKVLGEISVHANMNTGFLEEDLEGASIITEIESDDLADIQEGVLGAMDGEPPIGGGWADLDDLDEEEWERQCEEYSRCVAGLASHVNAISGMTEIGEMEVLN